MADSPLRLRAALVAILAVATVLVGCRREHVRTAPFRARPDTVEAGDLRGPFDGQVVDQSSSDAVAGALVYATWTFERGYGLAQPAGFHEVVTSTDASGRYDIDAVDDIPDDARVTSFSLVIYKRGYVAYRSDRRFADFGPRRDFAQHQNRVVLDRWRSDLSHLRHLRYVGGGPALAALTAWELEDAVAELDGRRGLRGPRLASDLLPTTAIAGRVVAAQVLGAEEIKAITDWDGQFETGPLNDEPDTLAYSSQHFRALGQPETYDVAVRVWKLEPDAAAKRYGELRDSLPGVEETDELATKSLRATEGSILGIGFYDQPRGIVVLLTCGTAQCDVMDKAVKLGATAHENIVDMTGPVAPAPAERPARRPAPADEAPTEAPDEAPADEAPQPDPTTVPTTKPVPPAEPTEESP